MIEIDYRETYRQPAAAVYAAIIDFAALPAWQADVLEARLSSPALAVGATVQQSRKIMGRRTEVTFTVAEHVPGQSLTLRTADGVSPAVQQSYRILAEGDTSVVEFGLQLDGVPRMAEHLARAQLGKTVPKMFEKLGDLLEAR